MTEITRKEMVEWLDDQIERDLFSDWQVSTIKAIRDYLTEKAGDAEALSVYDWLLFNDGLYAKRTLTQWEQARFEKLSAAISSAKDGAG